MKLISVVIPTYNRAKHIVNAVQSVINQTYSPVEIIVIDDGSTDNTQEFLNKFGDKIRYVKKENGGVSSARNYGIKISNGDLIAFLDSDDVWLPDKLEKQVTYLEQHPDFGMVLCDCYYSTEDGSILSTSTRRSQLPNDGYIINDVIINPSLIPSSVLVIKDLLLQVDSFDGSLKTAEDLDLHLKLALITKIGLISEPLFKFMRGHEGLSMLSCTYDDHVRVVENFIARHDSNIQLSLRRKALFIVYKQAAKGKLWHNEWLHGVRYCLKAILNVSAETVGGVSEVVILAIKVPLANLFKKMVIKLG